MKHLFITLLFICAFSIHLTAQPVQYDPCGELRVAMLTADRLVVEGKYDEALAKLNKFKNDPEMKNCPDMKDGIVDYKINEIQKKNNPFCPDTNHPHQIDLGLPSGTMWACCNVDASKPQEYGGYFAWGEIADKKVYNDVNYHFSSGEDTNGDGKYDKNEKYENIGKNISGTQYDVARMKWKGLWLLPSREQIDELLQNCKSEWISFNGINGYRFTGSNGNSIFLPASGERRESILGGRNQTGYYLSSTQHSNEDCAYQLYFNDSVVRMGYYFRRVGETVRPVAMKSELIPQTQQPMNTTSKSTSLQSYKQCPDNNHPHLIDLGLPSGTKWACCNLGAKMPEGYGGYYAWGETEEKKEYTWKTYIHCDGTEYTCHDIGKCISGTQYDVAHVKLGGSWQMPTYEQINELMKYCTSKKKTINGIKGRMLISNINGGSIFFPPAGWRSVNLGGVGESFNYWSGSNQSGGWSYKLSWWKNHALLTSTGISRCVGYNVRPVAK